MAVDTKGLNLQAAGLKALNNGKLVTNDDDQTEVSHIYAIGDCAQGTYLGIVFFSFSQLIFIFIFYYVK